MKTISRVYDSYAQARAAVADLVTAGIGTDDISVVANKHVSAEYAGVEDISEVSVDAAKGAGIGGAIGGGAGLLAGIGLLVIPGLGPVVAAGWLAATAVGVAAGAATGGIVGALVGAGIDRDHAEVYSESIRRGSTLVTARVLDEEAAGIERILGSHRPVDPAVRAADYAKEGWTKFDPEAPAYRPNQAEVDRMRENWPAS